MGKAPLRDRVKLAEPRTGGPHKPVAHPVAPSLHLKHAPKALSEARRWSPSLKPPGPDARPGVAAVADPMESKRRAYGDQAENELGKADLYRRRTFKPWWRGGMPGQDMRPVDVYLSDSRDYFLGGYSGPSAVTSEPAIPNPDSPFRFPPKGVHTSGSPKRLLEKVRGAPEDFLADGGMARAGGGEDIPPPREVFDHEVSHMVTAPAVDWAQGQGGRAGLAPWSDRGRMAGAKSYGTSSASELWGWAPRLQESLYSGKFPEGNPLKEFSGGRLESKARARQFLEKAISGSDEEFEGNISPFPSEIRRNLRNIRGDRPSMSPYDYEKFMDDLSLRLPAFAGSRTRPGGLLERVRGAKVAGYETSHTATRGGNTYDIMKLILATGDRPAQEVPLPEISRSKRDGFSRGRYSQADYSFPIIVGEDGDLIDGRHRVARAADDGLDRLPARVATSEDLAGAKVASFDIMRLLLAEPPGRKEASLEDADLIARGHGTRIGSCVHVAGRCRCSHGGRLAVRLDTPCPACAGE